MERELQNLKYYTRRGRKLPDIPADKKAEIDYYIAARNNETEPSVPQLVQQVLVDFLKTTPLKLVTVGSAWSGYLQPLLAYALDKLMATEKYANEDFLTGHPNGLSVASALSPSISPVEIGYKKTANVVISGTYFLKWGSKGLVVSFDFAGQVCSLSATVPNEDKAIAEEFLSDFNRACAAFNIYKNQKLAMDGGHLTFIDIEDVKLGDVYLPTRITADVTENTVGVLEKRDELFKTPAGINRSVLAAGKPGTGKTQLFKALANTAKDCTVIVVSSKAFRYPSDVSMLYAAARDLGPSLLILEDMDLIGSQRRHGSGERNDMLGEFLTQMSGAESNRNIVTVASTNDLAALDEAMSDRPGRFDRVINVPLPSTKYRSRMLKAFLKDLNIKSNVTQAAWMQVMEATQGFTGAYIKEVARTLQIKSVVGKKVASVEGVVVGDADLISAAGVVKENFMASRKARAKKRAQNSHS